MAGQLEFNPWKIHGITIFWPKEKKIVYFFLFEIQTVALILTRVHFLIFLSRLRLLGSKAPRPSSIFMISHTFVLNKRGERGMKMFILIKGGCAQLSQDTKYTKIILRKIIVHIFLFFELNFWLKKIRDPWNIHGRCLYILI